MSTIKQNIDNALDQLRKNREELILSLRKDQEESKDSIIGSSMAPILRNSINKITEQIEMLEGLLKTETLYNFITYYPSVGENLDCKSWTEDDVRLELQNTINDMVENEDPSTHSFHQFIADWIRDKSNNAFQFENGDELFIQEVSE